MLGLLGAAAKAFDQIADLHGEGHSGLRRAVKVGDGFADGRKEARHSIRGEGAVFAHLAQVVRLLLLQRIQVVAGEPVVVQVAQKREGEGVLVCTAGQGRQ